MSGRRWSAGPASRRPDEDATHALNVLAGAATPGARLIGSCLDPYGTDEPDHLAYHEANRQRGRPPGHLRIRLRHRTIATEWFDYVLRSPDELAQIVKGSPWTLTRSKHDGPTYAVRLDLRT